MLKYFQLIYCFLYFTNCNQGIQYAPKNVDTLKYLQDEIKIPFNGVLKEQFNTLSINSNNYFCFLSRNKIFIADINRQSIIDSIEITLDSILIQKYGSVNSFCFNGLDSLFLIRENAIMVYERKKITQTILINNEDSVHYSSFLFKNLGDTPVFYNKQENSLVGQVYCHVCGQWNSSFYSQQILGKISLFDNKISLFKITYPKKYLNNYYGFLDHVYAFSTDSLTLFSFAADENIYFLNRKNNKIISHKAACSFQKATVKLFDKKLHEQRELKMRHLTTEPYYAEIKLDKERNLLYRIFLKEIDLKSIEGKYHNFGNKEVYLTVFDSTFTIRNEIKLTKGVGHYLSFVGKKGLYLSYNSGKPEDKNYINFKVFNFDKP